MKFIVLVVAMIAAITVDCRNLHGPRPEPPPPPTVILDLQRPPTVILDSQQSGDIAEPIEEAYKEVFEFSNESPVSADGLYQVDDMLLTKEQWEALRTRKAVDNEQWRWTEGGDGYPLVPYFFSGSVNRTAVQLAAAHWMEHTCIKFGEDNKPDQPHLEFQVHEQGNGTCASSVGMVSQTGQAIYVGGCSLGSVIHEIGHAMGFWHEQSRSDRDDYVIILTENIKPDKTNNFLNNGQNSNNYSVPYDYSSIMHYSATGFSVNGKLTLVTKNPSALELIGQRNGLSHRDKLLANRMYNCTGKWLAKCGISSDSCLNGGYTGTYCTCICPPGTTGSNCEVVEGDYYDGARNQRSEEISTEKRVTVETPMKSKTRFVKSIVPPMCKMAKVSFISSNMYAKCEYQLLLVVTDPSDVTGQTLCADDIETGPTITSETGIFITMINNVLYRFKTILWEADVTFQDIPGCNDQSSSTTTTTTTTTATTTKTTTTTTTSSTTTIAPGCGGEYTSNSGTIRHPLIGSTYGNNENCVWTIRNGNQIKITFISFDLENSYDHLYLRDGNSIESTELGNYTGSAVPSLVQTNSNAAYILFTSDNSYNSTGFELQWETLETPTDPPTTQPPTTVVRDPSTTTPSGCGGEYTSSSGTIRHPLSGSSYGNNENCVWTIRTADPIKITFNSFDLENRYDHLYLRDGNSIESTELGNYTGSAVPSLVQTNSNAAYILFTSDNSYNRTGFELQWETLETPTDPPTTQPPTTVARDPSTTTPSGCGGEYTSSSGTIRHPLSGSFYGSNENCVWTISTADPMKITFNSFYLENGYDHLYLRDGNSIESKELGNYTGSAVPSLVQTNSNAAYILFTSDHSVTRTGFQLQWET